MAMVCGPNSSMAAFILASMVSKASSQEMRSHLPSPLGPTCFIGYLIRYGLSRCCMLDSPLEHIVPLVSESGLPSMRTTTPSSLVTFTPQPPWQLLQVEYTTSLV